MPSISAKKSFSEKKNSREQLFFFFESNFVFLLTLPFGGENKLVQNCLKFFFVRIVNTSVDWIALNSSRSIDQTSIYLSSE